MIRESDTIPAKAPASASPAPSSQLHPPSLEETIHPMMSVGDAVLEHQPLHCGGGGGGGGGGGAATTNAHTANRTAAAASGSSSSALAPPSRPGLNLNVSNGHNLHNISILINPISGGGSGGGGGGGGGSVGGGGGGNDVNPAATDSAVVVAPALGSGTTSPAGTESPGTSQMSPPPSYHDIPGTVPAHQGVSRGPPPSYEDAVDPNAEPPSYDSLFGRIRDTHKASRNLFDFLAKLLILLLGTIGCTIACGITIIIPVCMIVVGSIYFNDCPAEPYIPVFLIVGGSFSVFKYLIGVSTRVRGSEADAEAAAAAAAAAAATGNHAAAAAARNKKTHPAQSLITCFLCGWFIAGCVWVYRIYWPLLERPDDPEALVNYCNQNVYVFAFWLITTAYIFLGLFTSCICCFSIVSVILKRD